MVKAAVSKTGVAQPATKRLRAVAGAVVDSEAGDSARLLYDRIRLGLMSALSVNASMSFAELKDLLGTTDGNLSKHARRLEDAGLIVCKKAFADRVPRAARLETIDQLQLLQRTELKPEIRTALARLIIAARSQMNLREVGLE